MAHAPRWTDVPVYGGPRLLPVSRVHPSLPLSVVHVHQVYVRVAGEGVFPYFSPAVVLLPVVSWL